MWPFTNIVHLLIELKTHCVPICIFILPTGVNTRCNPSLCNMISKFSVFCITVSTTCLNILETEGRKLQSWLWGEWNENKPAFLTLKIPVVGFRERWKKKKKQHQTWPNCSFHKKIQLIKTHPTHTHVCAGRGRHTHTHTHESPGSSSCRAPWRIKAGIKGHGAPVKYSEVSAGTGSSGACVSCTRTEKSKPRDSVPEPCTEKVSDTY